MKKDTQRCKRHTLFPRRLFFSPSFPHDEEGRICSGIDGGTYDRILLTTNKPKMRKVKKIARKIKKSIFAIPAAPAAISEKPSSAAMIEMTKKIAAHFSISTP
jgi:hypothetical protein